MSDRKRAHESGGDASSNKKFKSDTGAAGPSGGLSATDLIAQKRAEIAAKLAAMKNSAAGGSGGPKPSGATGIAAPIPTLPAKQGGFSATATVSSGPTSASGTPRPGSGAPGGGGITEDLARKVAEAKRRVAEAQSKLSVRDNPYMSIASQTKKKTNTPSSSAATPSSSTPAPQDAPPTGAGLNMAAHPLLLSASTPVLNQSKKDRYKPMVPKFASIKANVRNAPTPTPSTPAPVIHTPPVLNPYSAVAAGLDGASSTPPPGSSGTGTPAPSTVNAGGPSFDAAPPPSQRIGRSFRFNPKGKYVAMGNQMRKDIQLEELKQRIAESAKKAGMEGVGGEGFEKGIKRAPPPDAEWWDTSLLPPSSSPLSTSLISLNRDKGTIDVDEEKLREYIRTHRDSPITIYIQHPIPIPAPGDKGVELKPLMLTTKEQKKMRKLRRKEKLQDQRDRQRMGLEPPPPPKVRLTNLMKVLTSDAIQDPTRVEARVRKEVAQRRHNHEKANAARKLTDEQRREKVENKKHEAEKSGIWGAVYKIKLLSDPSHQFKVRKNAEQFALTGLCIFNPTFNLVYVEGAPKFMKKYKRLMLDRIAWTQAALPRGGGDIELDSDSDNEDGDDKPKDATAGEGTSKEGEAAAGAAAGTPAVDLESNTCHLVWEGVIRDRAFSHFRAKTCPTDREAREVLGDKMRGYWDLAKSWKGEEEEII
ncbi:small nuclear ribonucleoprotein hPrp3 [Coprinopsis sp. MPI-PUGE-AT-0042]|nr:small nuclear ribonucleoprotein hPrp3 [Coprinopsis sp. MPI-PUGE-AT-0042]